MVQITDTMYIHICTLGPLVWKQVELQYPKSVPKLDSVSRIVVYQTRASFVTGKPFRLQTGGHNFFCSIYIQLKSSRYMHTDTPQYMMQALDQKNPYKHILFVKASTHCTCVNSWIGPILGTLLDVWWTCFSPLSIPIDNNCAPLLTYLFICTRPTSYMGFSRKLNESNLMLYFNFHYIDDVPSLNNFTQFGNSVDRIYPIEL